MENRITNYWNKRVKDFKTVRVNELNDEISKRWYDYITPKLSKKHLKILDVGTGVGYFVILLGKEHTFSAIDLTPSMIEEANKLAKQFNIEASIQVGDAQNLEFEDESFDVILTRNLTWTLPDVKKAYSEMHRVLKPGGLLLNFDAAYSENIKNNEKNKTTVPQGKIYGHIGMNEELEKENANITLSMDIAYKQRPYYDIQLLQSIGFKDINVDIDAGIKILQENDLKDAPMFCIQARK